VLSRNRRDEPTILTCRRLFERKQIKQPRRKEGQKHESTALKLTRGTGSV
jgi:hypothetical protein